MIVARSCQTGTRPIFAMAIFRVPFSEASAVKKISILGSTGSIGRQTLPS